MARRAAPVVNETVPDDLPLVDETLVRAYQCFFMLRAHPDFWTYQPQAGGWCLEVERIKLRPGSDGVGGPDLAHPDVGACLEAWRQRDGGRWLILRGGDRTLVDLPGVIDVDGDPQIICLEDAVIGNQKITLHFPPWETLTPAGTVRMDWQLYRAFGLALAQRAWGLTGPRAGTVAKARVKIERTLRQLQTTADKRDKVPRVLAQRIAKVEKLLAAVSGVDVDEAPEEPRRTRAMPTPAPAPAPRPAPPPPSDEAPKRGRGRPRKTPPAEAQSDEQGDADVSA